MFVGFRNSDFLMFSLICIDCIRCRIERFISWSTLQQNLSNCQEEPWDTIYSISDWFNGKLGPNIFKNIKCDTNPLYGTVYRISCTHYSQLETEIPRDSSSRETKSIEGSQDVADWWIFAIMLHHSTRITYWSSLSSSDCIVKVCNDVMSKCNVIFIKTK